MIPVLLVNGPGHATAVLRTVESLRTGEERFNHSIEVLGAQYVVKVFFGPTGAKEYVGYYNGMTSESRNDFQYQLSMNKFSEAYRAALSKLNEKSDD